jgi:hypothetical protein
MSIRVGSTFIAGNIEVDSTITSASTNPVTGGAIYAALDGKQNTLSTGNNITINNDTIATSAAKVIIRRFS